MRARMRNQRPNLIRTHRKRHPRTEADRGRDILPSSVVRFVGIAESRRISLGMPGSITDGRSLR